jgi:2-polyprenyl-3-methyl-5-hydroxy-6-metoxy-1,4-benzoquinol methylase
MRLPSLLVATTRNLQRLLGTYIRPGMDVLEIGFAPGKQLAYVASVFGARVTGLDSSRRGVGVAKTLFDRLGIEADLRCEDVFSTTLPSNNFDFVYSAGLIEHFDDPRPLVRRHVEFLKPGGTTVMLVPNYRDLYGRLQRHFDPERLAIHNLSLMTCDAMKAQAPADLVSECEATRVGRVDPSLVSLHKRWPARLANASWLGVNALGVLQPFDILPFCPWIALRCVRGR